MNQEIRAPVIAFIAYKLGNLLIDSSWNVLGQKLDDSRDTGVGYVRYLDIAIAQRGITIAATIPADDDTEPRQTWLRIVHDTQARKNNFFCCLSTVAFLQVRILTECPASKGRHANDREQVVCCWGNRYPEVFT